MWLSQRLKRKSSTTLLDDLEKIGEEVSLSEFRRNLKPEDIIKNIKVAEQHQDYRWKKRYYFLRTVWAFLAIILLGLSLYFTYWLVLNVGKGNLDFKEYRTFLNIIAGEVIINILGLVAIVMHFLFPNNQKNKEK